MRKSIQDLTRKPLFWFIFTGAAAASAYLGIHNYSKAFPIVNLNIKMSRINALEAAANLAQQHHWQPQSFQQSASFDLDSQAQTFVELSNGGSQAFEKILKEGLYSFYTWQVRNFAEGQIHETFVQFTPEGEFYGFEEKLPENEAGAALSSNEALKIAEKSATQEWKVNLTPYKLVEKSQEARPSHRIDHSFVYERQNEKIGEGRYRLELGVSGDRLTEIHRFIKVPDAFLRHYAEMRSANDTLAGIASIAMVVLYLLCGCGIGLFLLARNHWVIWKTPVICAAGVAGFQFLEHLNQFPLSWMHYDTALSASGFVLQSITSAIFSSLVDFIVLAVSFMGAESLTRRAFPTHPQLWQIWKTESASSISILGRTVGGYLSAGFFFAYIVIVYIFGTHYLGWWSPSDTLFQPDGLATYCPWFTSIANSLHAGFWEECLFRAVPLASAALIGSRFNRRKTWIGIGLVVEALIFGAAHANYPAQPSYARLVELIIPSLFFGGLYLRFGLLPGMLLHYTFDAASFSIPLFAASTPNIWFDRVLVIALSLIPLWIVLIARFNKGHWTVLKPSLLNGGWLPSKLKVRTSKVHHRKIIPISKRASLLLCGASLVGLGLWVFVFHFHTDTIPLEIGRNQAIEMARLALEKSGTHLSAEWEPLASIAPRSEDEELFIWKTEGPGKYHDLQGNYLQPPCWLVRFVRFDVNVEERADEYQVFLMDQGQVYWIRHNLPEARKGASLDENEARKIALAGVEQTFHIKPDQLKDISSFASKLPQRKDWLFIFADPSIHLKEGQARIGIRVAGDHVVSAKRFIYVPENWERKEKKRQNITGIVSILSIIFILGIFVFGIIYALMHWTRRKFVIRTFLYSFLILTTIGIIQIVNSFPLTLARLSTQEPRVNQILTSLLFGVVQVIVISITCGIILGFLHWQTQERHIENKKLTTIAVGYSIGILGTVLVGFVHHVLPSSSPLVGNLSALNSFFPPLAGLETVMVWMPFSLTLVLLAMIQEKLTQNWEKRKFLGILFLMVFSLLITGLTGLSSIPSWIATGLAIGIYLTIAFRYWIPSNFNLIPLATAGMIILFDLMEIMLGAYRGTLFTHLASMVFVIAGSLVWYRRMYTKPPA